MGIRFYCPNGHRLNVKDFLAGKRGICPHCEVRFRIPRESEIPKGSPRVKPGSVAEEGGSNGKRRTKKSVKVSESHSKNGSGDTLLKSALFVQEGKGSQDNKGAQENNREQESGRDPIDMAPDAIWYVRPPSGGQYGPAKGEIMRRWVTEGRVSSDSLVWREGWADWQLAGPLFPAVFGTATNASAANSTPATSSPSNTSRQPSVAASSGTSLSANSLFASNIQSTNGGPAKSDSLLAATFPSAATSRTPLPSVTLAANRAPNKKKSVVAVVGLAVLIIVLAVVLVVVLVTKA